MANMPIPDGEFVVSGCAYTVTEVAGRPPVSLDDFVGDTDFTAVRQDQQCGVSGCGSKDDAVVRFHEKRGGGGRDLRIWQVTLAEENTYHATAIANY